MMSTWNRLRAPEGFSLVEVALALGIVSFCLIATVALLPHGINQIRISREDSAATRCLDQIAASIRGASVNGNKWVASGTYSNLAWTVGGDDVQYTFSDLSSVGIPGASPGEARLVARVEITPPSDAYSTGKALVSVAWPSQAGWEVATKKGTIAEGVRSTRMEFLPRQ